MSSRRWRRAAPTSRGMTSRRTRPSCGRTAASAYTTIFISSIPSLAWSSPQCVAAFTHLRVPTWAPFRLQFYCNGHSWLARQLTAEGIAFTAADNAFVHIDDWARAQALADAFSPRDLHRLLDRYAVLCAPGLDVSAQSYHW